jgi:hypothetical protein
MEPHRIRNTQSILLFIFTLVYAITMILSCFNEGYTGYYILPAISGVASAVFSGILLFKRDLDGDDYAQKLMLTMVLVCATFIVSSIMYMIRTSTFSSDLLTLAALVLFAICLAKNNPDERSWHVLNYIAYGFLTFLSGISMIVLLVSGGAVLSEMNQGNQYLLAGIILISCGIYYGVFLAYNIVSLIATKDQPLY